MRRRCVREKQTTKKKEQTWKKEAGGGGSNALRLGTAPFLRGKKGAEHHFYFYLQDLGGRRETSGFLQASISSVHTNLGDPYVPVIVVRADMLLSLGR